MTPPRRAAGFTLIEAAVVLSIIGILAAVGIPDMSNWLLAHRAQAAAEYYMEGLSMARNMAIEHNAASRLVLNENAGNGQMEWQIDVCFPTSGTRCDDANGSWSTLSTAASDPLGTGYKSVTRSAAGLPSSSTLRAAFAPEGATSVYFKPVGWIDTNVSPQLDRITLSPSYDRTGAFAPMAVALTLAGVASRCDPAATGASPRRCP